LSKKPTKKIVLLGEDALLSEIGPNISSEGSVRKGKE